MSYRKRSRWLTGIVPIVAVLASVLSACGSPGKTNNSPSDGAAVTGLAAIEQAAKKEGSVVIYTGLADEANKQLFAAFQAKYGIKGTAVRLTTEPMTQRFLTEAQNGAPGADMLFGAPPTFFESSAQYFRPMNADLVPETANWPKAAVGPDYIVWGQTPMVVAYSTKIPADQVPNTWADVAKSEWKGQVVLSDPRASTNYLGWADSMKKINGADYLKSVSALKPTIVASGSAGAQQVAAGSKKLNFPSFPGLSQALIDSGAPIKYKVLQDPVLFNAFDAAIAKDARHPNAARLFMNFLMTSEAETILCKTNPTGVPADPTGKYGCIPLNNAQQISYTISADEKSSLLDDLGL